MTLRSKAAQLQSLNYAVVIDNWISIVIPENWFKNRAILVRQKCELETEIITDIIGPTINFESVGVFRYELFVWNNIGHRWSYHELWKCWRVFTIKCFLTVTRASMIWKLTKGYRRDLRSRVSSGLSLGYRLLTDGETPGLRRAVTSQLTVEKLPYIETCMKCTSLRAWLRWPPRWQGRTDRRV